MTGEPWRNTFLLDPDVVYLNHGSFGACPRPVFDAYQNWQRKLENQPVEFLGRQVLSLLGDAREKLAGFINCSPDDVVYFPNPTTAINMVARSLDLQPGDEILTTDHEYGAMDRTWTFVCENKGAKYIHQPIPLPLTTEQDFVDAFWEGVTDRTRVIFLSHITSPTALIFPVKEICRRAREAGLLCIIDGAHVPGQIPLDIQDLGADIYTGACHKWLMAPKGAAFLYAGKHVQDLLEPLVVSWGYQRDPRFGTGIQFIDHHEWQGTRDVSAFLAVPAAIDFYLENRWDAVSDRCHHLARSSRRMINKMTGMEPICPESSRWFKQMFTAKLPEVDSDEFKTRLYEDYRIELPIMRWKDQPFIRVSVQGYNSQADLDLLHEALQNMI